MPKLTEDSNTHMTDVGKTPSNYSKTTKPMEQGKRTIEVQGHTAMDDLSRVDAIIPGLTTHKSHWLRDDIAAGVELEVVYRVTSPFFHLFGSFGSLENASNITTLQGDPSIDVVGTGGASFLYDDYFLFTQKKDITYKTHMSYIMSSEVFSAYTALFKSGVGQRGTVSLTQFAVYFARYTRIQAYLDTLINIMNLNNDSSLNRYQRSLINNDVIFLGLDRLEVQSQLARAISEFEILPIPPLFAREISRMMRPFRPLTKPDILWVPTAWEFNDDGGFTAQNILDIVFSDLQILTVNLSDAVAVMTSFIPTNVQDLPFNSGPSDVDTIKSMAFWNSGLEPVNSVINDSVGQGPDNEYNIVMQQMDITAPGDMIYDDRAIEDDTQVSGKPSYLDTATRLDVIDPNLPNGLVVASTSIYCDDEPSDVTTEGYALTPHLVGTIVFPKTTSPLGISEGVAPRGYYEAFAKSDYTNAIEYLLVENVPTGYYHYSHVNTRKTHRFYEPMRLDLLRVRTISQEYISAIFAVDRIRALVASQPGRSIRLTDPSLKQALLG